MIGQTVSHYRILEKLGEGGMGVVYLAEDVLLGRRVAVKSLTAGVAHGKQHFRTRFLREARAVSALSHPHIATIYDFGESPDGQPFIVMELVKGKTLGDLIHENDLTLARAVEIVTDIAEALAEAHRHGIVHRDIKPSNIAINERGEVKVLDFGLAKQITGEQIHQADSELQALLDTQTREGVVVGTPMYLSPEQAMGVPVDSRSDLFSLGALLYECIAGKAAFSGSSPVEICAQVIRDDPSPPSHFNPRVPPELDRITLKALSKKADARYQSADELIADLKAAQAILQKRGVARTATQRITLPRTSGRFGALSTLSDIFYRSRLPVGTLLIGLLVMGLIAWGIWRISRPTLHQPSAEAQRLFEVGTNALREGTYYKASKALERAIAADEQFALAHARLAEAWMELDYTDKAKDELLIVTNKLVPDRSVLPQLDGLYLNAVTATVTRDLDRAVKSYTQITMLKPDDTQAFIDLGRAYEKNDEIDKAIESYKKAAQLAPSNAVTFLRLGVLYGRKQDTANAENSFDKAEMFYQDSSNFEGVAEVLYQRGYLDNQAGRLAEARTQLQKALNITQINNNIYQQIKVLLELSRVAYSDGNTAQAKQHATEAVEMAKASNMENLTTQGLHDLGYAFFVRRAYADAEQYLKQALDFAQRYKGRNNEARVMLSLGSLYIQQEDAAKGLPFIEQALGYYREGGYRKEVSRCLIMLGRARLLQGDYDAALKLFDEQLQLARQVEDLAQVARSHSEIGSALAKQEMFPAALRHFDESYEINKSLGNSLNTGFSLLNKADMLAHLGRYSEARASLEELFSILNRLSSDNNNKEVWAAWAHLISARMALSERRFPEAKAECLQALETVAPQNKNTIAVAKATLGLVETFSGQRAKGRKLCEEASLIAAGTDDLRLVSDVRLVLAEALLESGDRRGALIAALQAQESFERQRKHESEWRAWLIAARASRLTGDHDSAHEQSARAGRLLSIIQQLWGAPAFDSYRSRLDVDLYYKQLAEPIASSNNQTKP